MINSIWTTPEVGAWSRNFDYENYLSFVSKINPDQQPFSEDGYQALCAVLDDEMEKDFGYD